MGWADIGNAETRRNEETKATTEKDEIVLEMENQEIENEELENRNQNEEIENEEQEFGDEVEITPEMEEGEVQVEI